MEQFLVKENSLQVGVNSFEEQVLGVCQKDLLPSPTEVDNSRRNQFRQSGTGVNMAVQKLIGGSFCPASFSNTA